MWLRSGEASLSKLRKPLKKLIFLQKFRSSSVIGSCRKSAAVKMLNVCHIYMSAAGADPQIVIAYRDSYHHEHKCSMSFPTIAVVCKALANGAPNGVFNYKYHIPEKIFTEFVSYIDNVQNLDKRRSLINVDNAMYFDALAKELQCDVLADDCKSVIPNMRAIRKHSEIGFWLISETV